MRVSDRGSLAAATVLWVIALAMLGLGCGRPAGPVPMVPSQVVGHCTYVNNFSRREECREYLGTGWTQQAATDDCRGRGSAVVLDQACNYPQKIGECLLNTSRSDVVRVTFPGNDASQCGGSRTGCEFFGGGFFVPAPICEGADAGSQGSGLPVFQQPVRECKNPLPGEPTGTGPNGQVCTWSAISASTEQGRRFQDYASCDTVRTQRPYYPAEPAPARTTPDPRLQNATYTSELNWVKSQIQASACVCCHSTQTAPRGTSNWYIEAPGNWMDSFYPAGLALGAGWVDSTAFGAYPPEQSNGFSRTTSGFPSTDPARMAQFFANELQNRGFTREDFATTRPFGGPIYDQIVYQPTACTNGEGVSSTLAVKWSGGSARYVYVLEDGSANPGVPPNLDTPRGTIWRVDVPSTGTPVSSGITFGQLPTGMTQQFPTAGSPASLVQGRRYYLYVLQDVGIPITRCLFTYGS